MGSRKLEHWEPLLMAMQGLHADLNVLASGLITNPAAMDERMSLQLSQLHVHYQMQAHVLDTGWTMILFYS